MLDPENAEDFSALYVDVEAALRVQNRRDLRIWATVTCVVCISLIALCWVLTKGDVEVFALIAVLALIFCLGGLFLIGEYWSYPRNRDALVPVFGRAMGLRVSTKPRSDASYRAMGLLSDEVWSMCRVELEGDFFVAQIVTRRRNDDRISEFAGIAVHLKADPDIPAFRISNSQIPDVLEKFFLRESEVPLGPALEGFRLISLFDEAACDDTERKLIQSAALEFARRVGGAVENCSDLGRFYGAVQAEGWISLLWRHPPYFSPNQLAVDVGSMFTPNRKRKSAAQQSLSAIGRLAKAGERVSQFF